jgi:hypothetical protein
VPIPRYALIIGSMKSGTTTLFNYLIQHPAIAGVRPKEPGFFAFDPIFAKGRDWYDALYGFDPERHVWALDGSTDYTKFPFCGDVPARMARFADAEYRLIYMMRHPLRRIESHARHVQRTRAELGRLPSDRPDHSLDAGISPVSLAASRYAEQLDQYRAFHDRGQVMLLTLEEFSADPQAGVARVTAFLGLDPLPALEKPKSENRAAVKRSRAGWWNALRAVPGLPGLITRLIPEQTRRKLDQATAQKVRTEGRFRLTPAEEEAVLADLRPDLIRLRDVYGVDVEGIWHIPLDAPIPAPAPVSVQRT